MIKVGVVGGTGYTGVELLRLLAAHPQVQLEAITSRSEVGMRVADMFPNLRGHVRLAFSEPNMAVLSACDVVFFATPNGVAMTMAQELLKRGARIIDLAADFRLKDQVEWEKWYGQSHACPELLGEAVYGLPELFRNRIRTAKLIANPGCYPTAVTLGFAPLLEHRVVDANNLIADAKSGVSGAGRKASVGHLLCEAADSFKAYSVAGHRHLPEITQSLRILGGGEIGLTFVPHLTPMIRGIHATLYATVKEPIANLQAMYEQRYQGEYFVDVMSKGAHPETRSVRGSNFCRIAVHQPNERTVVVLAVIDNLVKGAAGQAIQNMNIMFGFEEHAGLEAVALLP